MADRLTEIEERAWARLLESELDAIRKDPSRKPDARLDAHLELVRREEGLDPVPVNDPEAAT